MNTSLASYIKASNDVIERCGKILEDAKRSCETGVLVCDAAIAKIEKRATVKCTRCGIEVDAAKINLPGRCGDRACPVKTTEDVA